MAKAPLEPTVTIGGAPAGYKPVAPVGTPFGQATTPVSKAALQPTVTIGGAPAGYQPTTTLQPTVTIGGAPAGYQPTPTPNTKFAG